MTHPAYAAEKSSLCQAGQWLDARGYVPATSGNFSLRVAEGLLVTRSGVHKGHLVPGDILLVDAQLRVLAGAGAPSAEAQLHATLYALHPHMGAALHYHSVASTVLSQRHAPAGQLALAGYELLKAVEGITTHETTLTLPIFPNTQDMGALSTQMTGRLRGTPNPFALLIAGHGMYVWGATLTDALRHVEALEFMFECELKTTTSQP